MLSERPEFTEVEAIENEIYLTLGTDFSSQPRAQKAIPFCKRVSAANDSATKMQRLRCPAANKDMRRVFAYLCQIRGIAPEVVSAFAHAHLLYESADKHNAVFVGRDSQGSVKHIHMRGTLTDSHFRQTLAGSEKAFSFHYTGSSKCLLVFEAPIDLLSYITLHPEGWQENSYVALCGVGISPIERFLEDEPQLEEVTLCLDNDEAGHNAAVRIAKQLLDEWEVSVTAHFPEQKDWNEELLAGREQELEPVMAM